MNLNVIRCAINATSEYLAALFLLIILVTTLLRKKTTPTKKPFCIMGLVMCLLLLESATAWTLDGVAMILGTNPTLNLIRRMLVGLDYLIYSTLDDLFFLYLVASVRERRTVSARYLKRARYIFTILLGVSIGAGIIFSSSVWTEALFKMDASGAIHVTSGYFLLTLFGASCQAVNIATVIRERRTLGRAKSISCMVYLVVPTILIYMDVSYALTTSYISSALVIYTIYTAIDLEQDRQLLEREAEVARSETEKTDMKVSLMMSQIQPHFLYNTLSSIAYLCRKNPAEAEVAVNEFADYLKMNLRSINTKQAIPFEADLSHAENYLKIQHRRFPHQMNVVYDIQARQFRIPALTLQPIVENAVKHGVETRFEPTTIRVLSRETDTEYLVIVEDDGPGFDVNQPVKNDRPHIGIASVRSRLDNMVGGTMTIESTPGKGTTVTVAIPKERG